MSSSSRVSKRIANASARTHKSKPTEKLLSLNEQYEKLEKERNKLQHAHETNMSTLEDEQRLQEIDKQMQKFKAANTQKETAEEGKGDSMDLDPAAEESASESASESESEGKRTSESTGRELDDHPRTMTEPTTERQVDDLNMAWNISSVASKRTPSLDNCKEEVMGHLKRGPITRYLIRKGNENAYSVIWTSTPPNSDYKHNRDVTQRSNRIIESIVQAHRDDKTPLPMDILSNLEIIVPYWDFKTESGHAADVDVLAPDFPRRRPPTRCFTYLRPALYTTRYPHIANKSGYSHETRSTMKPFIAGNDDWQKSITLYNKVVRLENHFEETFMENEQGRGEPLSEWFDERSALIRRSTSRQRTLLSQPLISPTNNEHAQRNRYNTRATTFSRSPTPIRQPSTAPLASRRVRISTEPSSKGLSLTDRFHAEYLELFGLPLRTKYEQLSETQQILYPAQFTKWKQLNT
tara:strand:- start:1202 stop:2599 length:1398 start_codon:yes stop_codon:yes gene_type:complete